MENKINGRLNTTITTTTLADSTYPRGGDVIEAGYGGTKLSNDAPAPSCMSSSVRNFGSAGTLQCHGGPSSSSDGETYKDCNMIDASLAAKYYDRTDEYMKSDGAPWEDYGKVPRANASASESLNLSSATAAVCKFIKDEKEPSVIMDTSCPNFDMSSEIPALDTCHDAGRKQQLTLGGVESAASFVPGPRPALEGSPNFLIDLNQSEARTDSRCAQVSGKATVNYDAVANVVSQLPMYKSEVQRWTTQASAAESQYWYQSAAGTEDQFPHGAYEGIQTQVLSHRNVSSFPAFPG